MDNSEEDFTLEDLNKLDSIFRWTCNILGLMVITAIIMAGYKAWIWYIAIPIGSTLFFICRVMKKMFNNQIHVEKKKIKKKEQTQTSQINKISLDEFLDISPSEIDNEKITMLRIKQLRRRKSNHYSDAMAACFVMLMVGVFWYGVGRIIAL
jgi:hypothetical protein